MSKYNFYYDESEHSRKINYKTVSAANYYDNFVTMIVGWSAEKDDILQRHAAFETKYADRKDRNGKIKSTMFQQKQILEKDLLLQIYIPFLLTFAFQTRQGEIEQKLSFPFIM